MSDHPGRDDREQREVTPEEFIRRRPEQSLDQGPAAGPDAPETIEPTQGERPNARQRRLWEEENS